MVRKTALVAFAVVGLVFLSGAVPVNAELNQACFDRCMHVESGDYPDCLEESGKNPDICRQECEDACQEDAAVSEGANGGGGTGDGTSGRFIEIENPLKAESLDDLIRSVVRFLTLVAGSILVVVILFGAFQIMTSTGNPDRIRQGRNAIIWALVGFAVILIAGGLGSIIAGFLGGTAETLSGTEVATSTIDTPEGVVGVIDTIAKWMFNILLALGVVFVLVAAFQYLISQGDTERISTAKRTLIWAIAALVIGVLAGGIDLVVLNLFEEAADSETMRLISLV